MLSLEDFMSGKWRNMDIRKFCKKRLHVEVEASEASDATATATDVHAPGTAAVDSSKPVFAAIGKEQTLQVWLVSGSLLFLLLFYMWQSAFKFFICVL